MPDGVKWFFVMALVGSAIAGFYYFADQALLYRVVGLLVFAGIATSVALQTEKGRFAWSVAQEARMEVRKVVWPTRKETVQTTLIVIAMVTIVAIFMWMLDGLLAYVMRQLLGQGV